MKKQRNCPKTNYVAYVASSIDGRISLVSKKQPDWTSKEDWKFFQKSLGRFEVFVVGRNTFLSVASRLRKRNTFVLSSRVAEMKKVGKVTFINPKKINLPELFGKYKSVAILGGAMAYQTMLEKKLLKEIYVTVEPLIFGRGREMFVGGKKTVKLRLISMRKLNRQGTILLHYHVIN